jgi:hypothetical protein
VTAPESRIIAVVASVVLVLMTLSPVLRKNPYDDSFPLSTYPMFASVRPREVKLSYALGVTATGERRMLKPRLIGSGEILQAFTTIARAVAAGPGEQQKLWRVRSSDRDDIVAIRIVTGTHDAIDLLTDDKLGKERELTRCPVKR